MSDNFTISIDDKAVQAAFNDLIEMGDDLKPLFRDIGEYLLEEHQQRWENSVDSNGNLWEGLLLETWAKKKSPFMLKEEGDLLNSGVYQATSDSLEMGLSDKKAPWHHFGTETMPARELLGINDQDEERILEIITDHIEDSLNI